jgi:hypothetical protein
VAAEPQLLPGLQNGLHHLCCACATCIAPCRLLAICRIRPEGRRPHAGRKDVPAQPHTAQVCMRPTCCCERLEK